MLLCDFIHTDRSNNSYDPLHTANQQQKQSGGWECLETHLAHLDKANPNKPLGFSTRCSELPAQHAPPPQQSAPAAPPLPRVLLTLLPQWFFICLVGPFYSLFPRCSDWCSTLLICVNDKSRGAETERVWHGPCSRGWCWLLTPSDSFTFQSQPHECKDSGPKLITPQVGGGHHQESDRERDRERGRKWRGFFCSLPKVPLSFYFPSLSFLQVSNEWH